MHVSKKMLRLSFALIAFGMKHWLENALGYPNKPVNEDAIVVLLDPDQLIMRPFRDNDFSNTQWKFLKNKEPRIRIEHGAPMGQLYGFALQWKDKVTMDHISPNEPSYVDQMSRDEAHAGYCVGPPYIATAKDMYRICTKWSEFAPRVHDQYVYCCLLLHSTMKLHSQTHNCFLMLFKISASARRNVCLLSCCGALEASSPNGNFVYDFRLRGWKGRRLGVH